MSRKYQQEYLESWLTCHHIFRAFFGENIDPQLQNIVKSLFYKIVGEGEQQKPEHLEYVLEYMAAGHAAIISKWAISESTISTEELITLIKAINMEGPIKFLLTRTHS